MREILFRGKLLATGEWAYGNLDIKPGGKVALITPDDTPLGKYGMVDRDTVGEYTGLHGRNAVRIFTGDLVRDAEGNIGHVQFLIQAAGYVIVWKRGDTSLGHRARGGGYDRDPSLEVIGNIYDNPELLEGGTEK